MKKTTLGKVAGGLGLAALAAGVATTYFFSGAEGKKRKKAVGAWGEKAKKEMLAKIKQMKNLSKDAYLEATNEILSKYKQVKNIDPSELSALGKELKGHWDQISKDLKKAGKKTVTTITKKVTPKKPATKSKPTNKK